MEKKEIVNSSGTTHNATRNPSFWYGVSVLVRVAAPYVAFIFALREIFLQWLMFWNTENFFTTIYLDNGPWDVVIRPYLFFSAAVLLIGRYRISVLLLIIYLILAIGPYVIIYKGTVLPGPWFFAHYAVALLALWHGVERYSGLKKIRYGNISF